MYRTRQEAALKTLRIAQAKEMELSAKIVVDKGVKEDVAIKAQFDKLRSDLYVFISLSSTSRYLLDGAPSLHEAQS